MKKHLKYLIIGNGRVARHISCYFSDLQIDYKSWSRSKNIQLNSLLKNIDIVLFLISDDQIESFYHSNQVLQNKLCIHFAGALTIDGVIGIHPLMTFGTELYDKEFYQQIPFVMEESSYSFKDIFPDLLNPNYQIDKDKKALYHAKCVMACNFIQLLCRSYFDFLNKELAIERGDAALLIKKTISNFIEGGNETMTGPLVRKDLLTMNKNISSLEKTGESILYKEFIKTYGDNLCLP